MPPFEHLRDAFLYFVLPPALLAAALLALPAVIARHARQRDMLTQLGAALGTLAALALGCAINDRPLLTRLPEAEGWQWLPLVTLAALVVHAIAYLPRISPGAGWGLRGAVAANAGWLLTPGWLRGEHLWVTIALGSVILAEWAILEALAGNGQVPLLAALPGARCRHRADPRALGVVICNRPAAGRQPGGHRHRGGCPARRQAPHRPRRRSSCRRSCCRGGRKRSARCPTPHSPLSPLLR